MDSYKDSAQLEREVEAQRNRVEQRIGQIQERLSPGQLVDEMLSYTKHGGAHFASNLGSQVTANPIPAALIGIGLVWLMTGQGNNNGGQHTSSLSNGYSGNNGYQPQSTRIKGRSLQRVSHAVDNAGEWFSEFIDDSGRKYKAKANELGQRAGHFSDEAGNVFSGFMDDAGQRVSQFRDEAGNLLDEANGWASHTWQDLTSQASRTMHDVRDATNNLMGQAAHVGGDLQHNAERMTRDVVRTLERQPLIAGALAFAAGAALGAALPHTQQEDQLMGEAADNIKKEAGHVASDLYAQGKDKASEIYEQVAEKASEVYEDAKSTITDAASQTQSSSGTQNNGQASYQ